MLDLKYMLLSLSVCFVQVSARVFVREELFPLHIVHFNDFHARFEETSVKLPVCTANDTTCLGGFARLYHEIQILLQQFPDSLVLNAGDTFQNTYWYSILKWNVTQKFMNTLPIDAHTLGNHEFDDGIEGLAPYLAALHAPVVAANIDTSKEPLMNDLYKPHIIIHRNGRRIGIIGLITPWTAISSNGRNTIFLDPIPVVEREANLLTEQGVDIIIVLSHCGIEVDKQIAKKVGRNIDVIVGGHSHTLQWNGTSPSNEEVYGPYPEMVATDDDSGHKVIIVTASAFTKYLGNLTVYFDEHGDLQSFDGSPIFLNRSIPEDPNILALLQPYKDSLHRLLGEVVGFATDSLRIESCDSQECAFGNFVADSILNEAKQNNPTNLTSIAFLIKSNHRASLTGGEITNGDILNVHPFSNYVVSMEIAGVHILQALEKCLSMLPYNAGKMPMFSGLQVTMNITSHKVVSVFVKKENEFKPLDMAKEYQINTLNFLARGGDGMTMFRDHKKNYKFLRKYSDVITNYVKLVSPITPSALLDNRLIILQ